MISEGLVEISLVVAGHSSDGARASCPFLCIHRLPAKRIVPGLNFEGALP